MTLTTRIRRRGQSMREPLPESVESLRARIEGLESRAVALEEASEYAQHCDEAIG